MLLGTALPTRTATADDDEIPFARAQVLLQLNDTDGDLGFHARIDGEPWRVVTIEDPDEREIFRARPRAQLARQGMTEFTFESHEPPFDELSPDAFFARFPEGTSEIDGKTLSGEELESEAVLSHVMPAPAANITAGGHLLPESCDDGDAPVVPDPVAIGWDPVTHSHSQIGPDVAVTVRGYELVIEREEPTPLKFQVNLPAEVTQFALSPELIGAGEEYKVEVLIIADNGDETGVEACFVSAGG